MSKNISLLLYLTPILRQGIGEAKGCEFDDWLARPVTPATLSTFCRRDGGSTMSRRAFGYVVDG